MRKRFFRKIRAKRIGRCQGCRFFGRQWWKLNILVRYRDDTWLCEGHAQEAYENDMEILEASRGQY